MVKATNEEAIESTLLRLASPRLTPKELLRQTRRLHPDASKKQIVRAAFSSLIAIAGSDVEKAVLLHDFALKERGGEDA